MRKHNQLLKQNFAKYKNKAIRNVNNKEQSWTHALSEEAYNECIFIRG